MRQSPIEPVLRLSHVSIDGGVQDLSCTVDAGEIVTLLGADAASLLAVIAGYARAAQGSISVSGQTLDRTPPQRRGIGVLGAKPCLFPHLDVMAHASYSPGISPSRAQAVLERLDLAAFAGRLPASLAPDQQIRTGLARALAAAPRLLLLDDPLAMLSPGRADTLKHRLRRIAAEDQIAILHATTEASRSFGLCDRIGVLAHGRLRQIGRVEDIYTRPESLIAAQALGAVNRLGGVLLDTDGEIARIRLSDGIIVEAQLAEALLPGTPCVVALRPEGVAVAQVPAAEMGLGAIPARLIETMFMGEHMRLRLRIGLVDGHGEEIILLRPGSVAPPRLGVVSLAWRHGQAHVFAEPTP
jgi:putative spermidine/putrescine transport system ATP-binding protein